MTRADAARPRFGGPDSVETRLEKDAEVEGLFHTRLREPYRDFKKRLAEKTGLSFGLDYSTVFLAASESLGDRDAAGGMVRFFGSWEFLGRGSDHTGALVWKVEHRHRYTDVPPGGFGFNLGSVGLIEPPFNNDEERLTHLYWRQRLDNGRFVVIAGLLDVTDYVDVFALGSPWLHFMNFAFSTGTTTIGLPNDGGLGIAAGAMITDQLYVVTSLSDANADPTDPFQDTFFSEHEYFKSLEIGWTTSQDRIYLDNAHVTLWHKDDQGDANVPDGWGIALSFSHYFRDRWMPFLRGGFAEDGGTLTKWSISTGFAYQAVPNRDLLGVGFNWGNPNGNTFGPNLDSQYVLEAFYRFQLTDELAITPDLQLLIDPALTPDADVVWVFGLRGRLAL
jgi:porin